MDDLETFKASRQKMDPSTRKFSDAQWKSAYAAYCSSRKRVSGSGHSDSKGSTSKRRRKSSKETSSRSVVTHSPVVSLRSEVRQNSAYSDLRMIIDMLAWIAIGVAVAGAVIKLAYYTDSAAVLASIMDTVLQVIAVVVLRLLAHVVIDIPDIALHRRIHKKKKSHGDRDAD